MSSAGTPLSHEHADDSYKKLEITICRVLNMHIVLQKLQKDFINPPEPRRALMMDGCTFLGLKISTSIHCHYKAWKAQDIFYYNSDYFNHIHLGWLEGE